jgi:hypothetical protein
MNSERRDWDTSEAYNRRYPPPDEGYVPTDKARERLLKSPAYCKGALMCSLCRPADVRRRVHRYAYVSAWASGAFYGFIAGLLTTAVLTAIAGS